MFFGELDVKIIKAPVSVRAAVHAIVVGHMAAVLIQSRSELSNTEACRVTLAEAGFGDASINRLLTRAIASAAASINAQGLPS